MIGSDVQLVQSSFEKVVPIADTAASLFYGRLFELEPKLKYMFSNDLSNQGKKLMATLTVVVRGLHKPESIIAAVQSLGVKHNDYNVKPEHYNLVGEALIWTLKQGLGDSFTASHKSAWLNAYTLLSSLMIEASSAAKNMNFGSKSVGQSSQFK